MAGILGRSSRYQAKSLQFLLFQEVWEVYEDVFRGEVPITLAMSTTLDWRDSVANEVDVRSDHRAEIRREEFAGAHPRNRDGSPCRALSPVLVNNP